MDGRIGCQTYTWEMLGASWQGSPDDILDAVSAAGYDGIEFSNALIGGYEQAPDRLAAALAQRKLKLAAFACASTGFTDPSRYEADLAGAERALAFCRALGVPLCLGGAAAPSRDAYDRHTNPSPPSRSSCSRRRPCSTSSGPSLSGRGSGR